MRAIKGLDDYCRYMVRTRASRSPSRQACQPLRLWPAALALLGWSGCGLALELPDLDCVIGPYATADVASPVPGVLREVHVDRSDLVEQGQIVAQLESSVEEAAVALARSRAAKEAEIRLAEIGVKFDNRTRKRLDSLHESHSVSSQVKDEAERDVAASAWKLRRAKDLHEFAQLELRRAEEVLKQKTIRSPLTGVVVQRFRSAGEYVEDQPILRIAQLDPLHVEAIAPMELFGQIPVGMQAEIRPEVNANGSRRATVTVVDRMGDAASGTFGVRLELPNPGYELPAGLKCIVQFLPDAEILNAGREGGETNTAAAEDAGESAGDELAGGSPVQEGPDNELLAAPDGESSENALAAGPPSTNVCRILGPLQDSAQAERLLAALAGEGYRVTLREDSESVTAAYIVLAAGQKTPADLRRLQARLKENGLRDTTVVVDGEYAGRLSLGVYRNRRNAERRRHALFAEHQTETDLEEITQRRSKWWLELEGPSAAADDDDLRAAIDAVAPELEIEPATCESLVTARS